MAQNLKILHTGDIHLGSKFSFLGEKATEYRRALVKSFESLADTAIEKKVDLVIISGDLFDSPFPSRTTIEIVKRVFKKLVDEGIYTAIIPGNHDYLAPSSIYTSGELTANSGKLIVFNDPANPKFVHPNLKV